MQQAHAEENSEPPARAGGAHTLQAFLARLIWLCVAPLVLVAVYLAFNHVQPLLAEHDHQAAEQAGQAMRLVDRQLREQIAVMQMMAASPLLADPPRLEEFYRAASSFRDNFGGDLVLADRSFQMVMNTRLPWGAPLPKLPRPRGHAAAPEVLATGRPAVGDMFPGPIAHEPLVAVVVPVMQGKKVKYLLLSTIPTRLIQQHLSEVTRSAAYVVTLRDSKQEVMARSESLARPEGEAEAEAESAHRFLVKSSVAPWTLVLAIPDEVYRAPILAAAAYLAAAILLVTLVSILGGRLVSRRLGRAVASLAQDPAQGPAQGPAQSPALDTLLPSNVPRVAEIEAVRGLLAEMAAARQAAESIRHESDRRFRQLFESAAVPLCFVSAEGVFTEFNRRFEQTFGYSHEDVPTIEQWWRLAYPDPEYRRWVIQTWEEALHRAAQDKDDIKPYEYQVTCKDGRVLTMVISGITLGEDFLATFFDVTERKRAEAGREELFQQWQLALNAARMGWWRYDPRSKVSSWDSRYREIFQVEGEQCPNERILERLHPDDLPAVWAAVEAALDPLDPQPYFAEYRLNLPDGRQRWVEAHGLATFEGEGEARQAVSLVGTVADITERKQAELDLRQSQAAIRALLDATTDVVMLLDRDFNIVAANEFAAQRWGLTPSSLRGRAIVEFMGPEVRDERMARFQEILSQGRPLRVQDHHQGHYFDSHFYPVSDEQGHVNGIAIYARDITQSVEDDAKRSALEKQLLQSQKMEAVGTLAGGIAHDFNNILGAILGYAEMALDDARKGKPAPGDLEQVMKSAERAKNLVRQILTFSRKVEVEMRPLDLNKEVAQAALLLGNTIPKMIQIETDLAPELWAINANANQMEQILLNLGVNAAHAMAEGGRLRIQTANVMVDEGTCHTCGGLVQGPYVTLSVADNGQGMDAATREHIFEPFFTTKGPGKGTGLGLSTVHGIVTNHGGHIACDSAPGQGATFTIYFPALVERAEELALDKPAVEPVGGQERLLLVDDEELLLELASRLLAQAGYTVATASSGEQAVQTYESMQPRPDLVLMDLGMPGMGGRKALAAMLALDPQARVVIASGYGGDQQVKEALAAGARGFVAKPYRRVDLLATLRRVLDAA